MSVHVDDLTLRFAKSATPLIHKLSFRLDAGRHHALCGKNGSGKSTVLKVLSGEPDSSLEVTGSIRLSDQKHLFSSKAVRTHFGFVSQDYDSMIANHFSFHDNLCFSQIQKYPSFYKPLSKAARVPPFLERFGINQEIPARLLSGGQRQILALLMALKREPRLLLLDEPTATMDATNAQMVFDFLHEMIAHQNLTVLTVCHDHELLQKYVTGTTVHLI